MISRFLINQIMAKSYLSKANEMSRQLAIRPCRRDGKERTNKMIPKFRAWDNINKVMLCEIDVYHDGQIGFDYLYAQQVYDEKLEDASESWMAGDDYFWMEDGFVLTQYSGRNDFNKKELFAGDILQDKYGRVGTIEYVDGEFLIRSPGSEALDDILNQWLRECKCVCVGNRYQNPERIRER